MEGIIILIATLAVFLAMGIYVLVKFLMGPDLPEGHRFEAETAGNKAVVIIDKKLEGAVRNSNGDVAVWLLNGKSYYGNELAKLCANAIKATEDAFLEKGIQKADVSRVVFWFATDETFESSNIFVKNAQAYSTSLSGIFGTKKTPMAVIRTRHISTVSETGQPACHELVHILNDASTGNYSSEHADSKLWLGPGGADSVEAAAATNWKKLLGTK